MAYNQNADIGIAFQTSWDNTASVNSLHFLPIINESIDAKIPELLSETMRGIFDEGNSYEGPHSNEGDIEIESSIEPLGVFLTAMFNQTANVNSGSMYTRTFKPRTADWDDTSAQVPFTVYKYFDTGSAMQYTNMNATTLELSVSNGEFLKAKMSCVGGGFEQIANTSATFPDEKLFTWDAASISVNGSANANFENLTITFNESVEAKHTLANQKTPSHTKRTGFRTIEISGTVRFADQTELQAYRAQSERALKAHFAGVNEVQSGYPESITIDLPLMRYTDHPISASGAGETMVSFTAKGKYSTSSATAVEITHVGSMAAYL